MIYRSLIDRGYGLAAALRTWKNYIITGFVVTPQGVKLAQSLFGQHALKKGSCRTLAIRHSGWNPAFARKLPPSSRSESGLWRTSRRDKPDPLAATVPREGAVPPALFCANPGRGVTRPSRRQTIPGRRGFRHGPADAGSMVLTPAPSAPVQVGM